MGYQELKEERDRYATALSCARRVLFSQHGLKKWAWYTSTLSWILGEEGGSQAMAETAAADAYLALERGATESEAMQAIEKGYGLELRRNYSNEYAHHEVRRPAFSIDWERQKKSGRFTNYKPAEDEVSWIHDQAVDMYQDADEDATELGRRLFEILDEVLTPRQKEILLAYADHGTFQRVADALDMPRGTVNSTVFTAKKKLKKAGVTYDSLFV